MKHVPIIITAYNPNKKLIDFCKTLHNNKYKNVIIINDGSNLKFNSIFKKIEKEFKYVILNHNINIGRGRSLKTAFDYALTNFKKFEGCLTINSNELPSIDVIKKLTSAFLENPNCLVLGYKNYKKLNISKKSKIINYITIKLFKLFCGLEIKDYKTELRIIPKEFMSKLLKIPGDKYEFEINMLIECKNKYDLKEIEIEPINYSTNYNISYYLKTYTLIFKTFLKYIFSAISSFAIDILLFSIFVLIFKEYLSNTYIIISSLLSRFFSSIYNYLINYMFVFNSNSNKKSTAIKYFSLVIIQLTISTICVTILSKLFFMINETVIKFFVDLVLFFSSFFIQRLYIFKKI